MYIKEKRRKMNRKRTGKEQERKEAKKRVLLIDVTAA